VQETVTVLAREGCRGRNSPAVRNASKGEVQERERGCYGTRVFVSLENELVRRTVLMPKRVPHCIPLSFYSLSAPAEASIFSRAFSSSGRLSFEKGAYMADLDLDSMKETIEQLRKDIRKQRLCSLGLFTATLLLAFLIWFRPVTVSASNTDQDGIMHVHGLVVDDSAGHERLRLGAPLPGPLIHGVRVKRNGVLSGILLTDATGTERSGYATEEEGEAFLTLDSQHGQEMTLLSNPGGGVNFDISDPKGNEAAITVFPDGPKLKMKKAKQLIVELPAQPKPDAK
jgi:hypothetical protein